MNGALFGRAMSAITARSQLVAQRAKPATQTLRTATLVATLRSRTSTASVANNTNADMASESSRSSRVGGDGGARALNVRALLRARVRRLLTLYSYDNMST